MNEKQRIKAILALGQKTGMDAEAQRIAFETEMSPADAALALLNSPSYRLPAQGYRADSLLGRFEQTLKDRENSLNEHKEEASPVDGWDSHMNAAVSDLNASCPERQPYDYGGVVSVTDPEREKK